MVLLDPLEALLASFVVLAALLYKRVSIGIALVSSAMVMSLLSMNLTNVVGVFIETTVDSATISLVLVTFGIMVLSLLYKETRELERLCRSFGAIVRNSKIVVSVLPAIIGLLPVPGGALMSAPIVETETERLELEPEKKAYLNIWFRHVIFPIYPMSQVLILTATLTGVSIISIIISQVPVVIAMIVVGYFTVIRRLGVSTRTVQNVGTSENLKNFVLSFSPIVAMVLTAVIFKVDVFIAALVGVTLLLFITRFPMQALFRTLSNSATYKVALAAYGAMLLRGVTVNSGASETLGQMIATMGANEMVLLLTLPLALAFLVGSSSGAIAVSVPILAGILNFTFESVSLLFISAYLGYMVAPTHLCLALTVDYFRCSLTKLYRILVPSLIPTFAVAALVYLFQ